MNTLLEFACALVREASGLLRRSSDSSERLRESNVYTDDLQYASELDSRVNKLLVSRIAHRFPDHAILSEESGLSQGSAQYTWILDPIDGTTQFVRRLPYYSVSVAVASGDTVRWGIVGIPSECRIFVGGYEARAGIHYSDRVEPVTISDVTDLGDSLIACSTFGSFSRLGRPELFDTLNRRISRIRVFGSPGLDLCRVAEGKLDARIIAAPQVWDYAGGIAIVEAAGGEVTDWEGMKPTLESSTIVASNGRVHSQLLDLLAST